MIVGRLESRNESSTMLSRFATLYPFSFVRQKCQLCSRTIIFFQGIKQMGEQEKTSKEKKNMGRIQFSNCDEKEKGSNSKRVTTMEEFLIFGARGRTQAFKCSRNQCNRRVEHEQSRNSQEQ